jgi:predicted Zn-dependent protease
MASDEHHPTSAGLPASVLDPELPGGRAAGRLFVERGSLRFEADTGSLRWPLEGLELRLGGASDRLLFLTHPSQPATSLYTSDHSLLQHSELRARPALVAQISGVAGKKLRARLLVVAVLAAVVLAVLGLLALEDPIVGVVADRVPPSLEVRLGNLIFSQIEATTTLVEDPQLQSSLEELVAPLLAAAPETGYDFELHLADDDTINAFALPGGNIVLHSGLILHAESPEEVLGVLAHEIAHVTERHTLRQLVGSAGLYILVQALLGDMSGLVAVVADGGLRFATLRFSRDFEREADDVGWAYLLEAEIDPRGMIRLFERLAAQAQEQLGDAARLQEALAFLGTHPTSQERIERLSARWQQIEVAPRLASLPAADFAAFQDAVRSRLGAEQEEGKTGEAGSP